MSHAHSTASMFSRSRIAAACIAVVLAATGCSDTASSTLPEVSVKVGTQEYRLEVAADEPAREKGLMQRDSLPAGRGMIFVFQESREQAFWMKNTRFPLDIIYVDEVGKVVSVSSMKAYSTATTPSRGACRFAIELNGGQAALAGVKRGDAIQLPPEILKKAGL